MKILKDILPNVVLAILGILILGVIGRIGYNLGYGQGQWDCALDGQCRGHNHGLPPPR